MLLVIYEFGRYTTIRYREYTAESRSQGRGDEDAGPWVACCDPGRWRKQVRWRSATGERVLERKLPKSSSSRVCALPPRAVTLRLREIRYAHAIQQRSDSTEHIPYDFTCLRYVLLMLVNRFVVTSVEHVVLWRISAGLRTRRKDQPCS